MEYYFCLGRWSCFRLLLLGNGTKEVTTKRRLRSEEEGFATLWCFQVPSLPPLWRSFSGRPGRFSCHKSCSNLKKVQPHLLLCPMALCCTWRKVLLLLQVEDWIFPHYWPLVWPHSPLVGSWLAFLLFSASFRPYLWPCFPILFGSLIMTRREDDTTELNLIPFGKYRLIEGSKFSPMSHPSCYLPLKIRQECTIDNVSCFFGLVQHDTPSARLMKIITSFFAHFNLTGLKWAAPVLPSNDDSWRTDRVFPFDSNQPFKLVTAERLVMWWRPAFHGFFLLLGTRGTSGNI